MRGAAAAMCIISYLADLSDAHETLKFEQSINCKVMITMRMLEASSYSAYASYKLHTRLIHA